MKIKRPDGYYPLQERIDGVAYGISAGNNVANIWRYPTSRPSAKFSRNNELIRKLDEIWYLLTDIERDLWRVWVEELSDRELCILLSQHFASRDTEEAAKAGFVNCNMTRHYTGFSYDIHVPPAPEFDALPDGDTLVLNSTSPFVVEWERTGAPIDTTTAFQLMYKFCNTAPARPVPDQHLSYFGYYPISYASTQNLTTFLQPLFRAWHGRYCYMMFCIYCVGSAPFVALPIGTVLPDPI